MQPPRSKTPYTLFSTDHHFFIKSEIYAQKRFLKISRLTSKMVELQQENFSKQTEEQTHKSMERVCLIMGIIVVLEQPYLVVVRETESVATMHEQPLFQIKNVQFIPFKHRFYYKSINQTQNEKVMGYLKEQIIQNNFYFSYTEDLTLNYHKSLAKLRTERKYFWNEQMLKLFTHYRVAACWRIPVIQGYIQEMHCSTKHFTFYYLTISRRSKFMSGTRFNSRGLDSACNASNFVETQELFFYLNFVFSHISVRGSAPIFWNQEHFGANITFLHSYEANETALSKHYETLQKEYGADILTINLISNNRTPESDLKKQFQFYYNRVFTKKQNEYKYFHYDLNEVLKESDGQKIVDKFMEENVKHFSPHENFLCIDRISLKVYAKQKNVPRINCLDCIDRTNVVMSRISLLFLAQVELYINSHSKMEEKKIKLDKNFYTEVIQIWVEIGNRISRLYCGTESVATHLTKQQNHSFFTFVSNGFKSLSRYYNANVEDGFKQDCIEYLLETKKDGTSTSYFQDNITKGIIDELKYCKFSELTMYILTWNCNNVDPERLSTRDKEKLLNFQVDEIDLIVICLQEMVQLSSYNVLIGNNQTIVTQWKHCLEQHLQAMGEKKGKEYHYVTSYDLVGIATFVFASTNIAKRIFRKEWLEAKTGFKGSLGNKGAITLFLQIDSSFITFINCHLAAGENSQSQRAQDIEYIHNEAVSDRHKRKLFDKGQFRFFIGDMNFRLQAKNENVKQIIYRIEKMNAQRRLSNSQRCVELQSLFQKDEFFLSSNTIRALGSYTQAAIYFLPTYKYVKKENVYDAKRTPSWCDRILYYTVDKKKLSVLAYMDVECYESDHKGVAGIYRVLVKDENEDKKRRLIEVYMNEIL